MLVERYTIYSSFTMFLLISVNIQRYIFSQKERTVLYCKARHHPLFLISIGS